MSILIGNRSGGTAFSAYAWTSIMHHVRQEVKLAKGGDGAYISEGVLAISGIAVYNDRRLGG
jgi:hypothetical protein